MSPSVISRMSRVRVLCLAACSLHPELSTRAADVRFDGSVGKTVPAPLTGSGSIPGDAGDVRGENLFHSFSAFSIGQGEKVTFLPVAGQTTKNIIARVTGKNRPPSQIDGTIASAIDGANLYLMNPSGVIFGSNASLDIKGSFFATTADHINLGPTERFVSAEAVPSAGLKLPPSGFGFGRGPHGAITVEDGASLRGAPGTTLGLVGGRVNITNSSLEVERGEVHVASISTGTLTASTVNGRTSSKFAPGAQGDTIRLRNVRLSNAGAPALDAGLRRVVIHGGTLAVANSKTFARAEQKGDGIFISLQKDLRANGAEFEADTYGDLRNQPTLLVAARNASLENFSFLGTVSVPSGKGGDLRLSLSGRLEAKGFSSVSNSNDNGSPLSGGLFVTAASMDLDSAFITADNPEQSPPGVFKIAVREGLSILGDGEIAFNTSRGVMQVDAGQLTVRGTSAAINFNNSIAPEKGARMEIQVRDRLALLDGGEISATTIGNAAREIAITAGEVLLSGERTGPLETTGITGSSQGKAGSLGGEINLNVAGTLSILFGATINSNTKGPGEGGRIAIRADKMIVTGRADASVGFEVPHGITAQNESTIGGPSGSIELNVRALQVLDRGEVNASTEGSGRGGNIVVNGDAVEVSRGGRIVAETFGFGPTGPGGDIHLELSDNLRVGPGGSISVSTRSPAPGGNLEINAKSIQIEGSGAEIAARSGTAALPVSGAGGSIEIKAGRIEIGNGGLLTSSTQGLGLGGNVAVTVDRLSIHAASVESGATGISAQTLGRGTSGPGGRINLKTKEAILEGAGARVTTSSSGSGNAGAIDWRGGEIILRREGSIQSASSAAGLSGSVKLDIAGAVRLEGGSFISVEAPKSIAGDVRIRAGKSIRLEDSSITGQAALTGGSVSLEAHDLVFLRDSRLTASANSNGGNIDIDPRLVVLDHSLIDASAVLASGGNIHIHSDFYLRSPESLVNASSERGIDGEVQIDALNIDLTGSLVKLPGRLLDAEALLRELCTMKLDDFNSFVREGRGGLPPLPGGPLPSLEIVP